MTSGFVWAASLSFHEGHIYSLVLFYTYTFPVFQDEQAFVFTDNSI